MASVISKDCVVSMNYVLKDREGEVIDESRGEPLLYLHGHGNIIPGLEKALENLKVGDKKKVEVPSAQGYGEFDPDKQFGIPGDQFPPDVQLQPGMMLELTPDDGPSIIARITKVTPELIEVDANHALAGKDLFFDVEIVALRTATPDELAHGHAHGPGGHHHH